MEEVFWEGNGHEIESAETKEKIVERREELSKREEQAELLEMNEA